jgi:hypothetical protein
MIRDRLTMRELAAALAADPNTIRTWIEEISPPVTIETDKRDKRIKYISMVDAKRLAAAHNISLFDIPIGMPRTLQDCWQRIAVLESRIKQLQEENAALKAARPQSKRVSHPKEKTGTGGSGQYLENEWGDKCYRETGFLTGNAAAHIMSVHMEVSEQSVKRHTLNDIDVSERQNRQDVINWLRSNGYFKSECDLETCPCHSPE